MRMPLSDTSRVRDGAALAYDLDKARPRLRQGDVDVIA